MQLNPTCIKCGDPISATDHKRDGLCPDCNDAEWRRNMAKYIQEHEETVNWTSNLPDLL